MKPSNDNIEADEASWILPKDCLLRFIEIEGRLVQYRDRDPELNKRVRDAVARNNLRR